MNSEYVLDNIKSMMETYLTAMLRTLEIESSATIQTIDPQEYIIGERDLDTLTMFPCILVYGKNSTDINDQFGYQERELTYEVLAWIAENDQEHLHRFVIRYGDAIVRILRKETYWESNLHTPIVKLCTFSDLYKSNVGYAQGVMIAGTIRYIIS